MRPVSKLVTKTEPKVFACEPQLIHGDFRSSFFNTTPEKSRTLSALYRSEMGKKETKRELAEARDLRIHSWSLFKKAKSRTSESAKTPGFEASFWDGSNYRMIICQKKNLIRPLTVKVLIFPNFPNAYERARSTPCRDILGTILIIPLRKGKRFPYSGISNVLPGWRRALC